MVRSTTRQVESEWDDTGRGLAEGLALHDRQVHSGGCGLHPAILAEPDFYKFEFKDEHCSACASAAVSRRVQQETDTKWIKAHPDFPVRAVRPYDGRRTGLVAADPVKPKVD